MKKGTDKQSKTDSDITKNPKGDAEKQKNIDEHPKPTVSTEESQPVSSTTGDKVDQHPRPTLRQVLFFTADTADSLTATAAASPCTGSTINTVGDNKDEKNIVDSNGKPTFIGNFHKGLPHNQFGEVIPAAYQSLLKALNNPTQANFANIQLGLGRKLTNPQAGLAKDTEGPDPDEMKLRSAPKVTSAEAAAEEIELYWMALLRDIPFTMFDSSPQIAAAAQELSTISDFTGPKLDFIQIR